MASSFFFFLLVSVLAIASQAKPNNYVIAPNGYPISVVSQRKSQNAQPSIQAIQLPTNGASGPVRGTILSCKQCICCNVHGQSHCPGCTPNQQPNNDQTAGSFTGTASRQPIGQGAAGLVATSKPFIFGPNQINFPFYPIAIATAATAQTQTGCGTTCKPNRPSNCGCRPTCTPRPCTTATTTTTTTTTPQPTTTTCPPDACTPCPEPCPAACSCQESCEPCTEESPTSSRFPQTGPTFGPISTFPFTPRITPTGYPTTTTELIPPSGVEGYVTATDGTNAVATVSIFSALVAAGVAVAFSI